MRELSAASSIVTDERGGVDGRVGVQCWAMRTHFFERALLGFALFGAGSWSFPPFGIDPQFQKFNCLISSRR
jgi:hypothetical protein